MSKNSFDLTLLLHTSLIGYLDFLGLLTFNHLSFRRKIILKYSHHGVREGNVFSPVCLFVHGGGGLAGRLGLSPCVVKCTCSLRDPALAIPPPPRLVQTSSLCSPNIIEKWAVGLRMNGLLVIVCLCTRYTGHLQKWEKMQVAYDLRKINENPFKIVIFSCFFKWIANMLFLPS